MLTPRTHRTHLAAHQNQSFQFVREYLEPRLQELDPDQLCALGITGSDARGESGSRARKYEVTLISPFPARRSSSSEFRVLSPESLSQATTDPKTPHPHLTSPMLSRRSDSAIDPELSRFLTRSPPSAHLEGTFTTPMSPANTPQFPHEDSKSCELEVLQTVSKIVAMLQENPLFEYDVHDIFSNPFEFKTDNGDTRIIPNRVLDLEFLSGNRKAYETMKNGAFRRLSQMNSREKKLFDRHFATPAYEALKSCLNRENASVNLDTGALCFDGQRNMSTKYTLLRPIQYHLTRLLIRAGNHLPTYQKLQIMPSFTTDKIRWMQVEGLIPSSIDVEEVCQSYDLALQWYEQSQAAFLSEGTEQISVDPTLLLKTATIIHNFVQATSIQEESSTPSTPLKNRSFTKQP